MVTTYSVLAFFAEGGFGKEESACNVGAPGNPGTEGNDLLLLRAAEEEKNKKKKTRKQ